ncbi:hypothetical protein [Brucella lupini]|uniref:hypothetical protein n=1 Tax=Brucella lupini TaxID=255457 RepID=UPI001F44B024|nr:hypothetical protein [Brucella lupini]
MRVYAVCKLMGENRSGPTPPRPAGRISHPSYISTTASARHDTTSLALQSAIIGLSFERLDQLSPADYPVAALIVA